MSYERLRPTYTFDEDRLQHLKAVVPEAFADGNIDWATLHEVLGEHLEDESVEHFGLSWPGKREARRLASKPSHGTLIPVPGQGVNEDTTRNIFIEGENLEVLKLLLKSYAGRVKMIYIDPPYNTGNDFIYSDNFTEPLEAYLRRTEQADEAGLLTSNPKSSGRYHSNWLNMMYPRLVVAKKLLSEDGIIVVSIDDNEVHHLQVIMNEFFGEENFIARFVWKSRQFPDARAKTKVSTDHEYILSYSNSSGTSFRGIERDESKFSNPDHDIRGPWMSRSILGLATAEQRPNLHFDLVDPSTRVAYEPPPNTGWRYSKDRMDALIQEGKIIFPSKPSGRPREKKFRNELQDEFISFPSIIDDVFTAQGTAEIREIFGFQAFDFPKPTELIRRFIEQLTGDDDVVVDYFAGSGSTAHASYRQCLMDNIQRRFVCIQIPEVTATDSEAAKHGYSTLVEIAKERLRRVSSSLQQKDSVALGGMEIQGCDFGVKIYQLDNSHYKPWTDYAGDDLDALQTQFDLFETPLVDGWRPENLLVEVMLIEGFPLDSTVTPQSQFTQNDVRLVESDFYEHRLWVCLDQAIDDTTIVSLDLAEDDVFVCLDSALSDQAKVRLSDQAKLKTI